ncbi:hypothetical protein FCULG_00001914 [Fusarium culmorum]|uniref:HNH nuclease domain-containing protein n=1 Tax=Fusarium culmorum TaxID=5516 RepID=A0A2T4GQH8_FUSCU|nr:hypothetical protein FCULG_00001914 [Fusarium culmorum]
MFNSGVTHLIEGVNIDRPSNALMLTFSYYVSFGDFRVYFETVREMHIYRIGIFLPAGLVEDLPDRSIDPLSARLLAVYHAIAHILHLSAAGYYIDHVLRDVGEFGIRADGSTDLSRLLKLRLGDSGPQKNWPLEA